MPTEIETDESYVAQSGEKRFDKGEYPFFHSNGKQTLLPCRHADYFTACTEQSDGECFGVIAIANNTSGLCTSFSADELREASKQLVAMADYIDGKNQ